MGREETVDKSDSEEKERILVAMDLPLGAVFSVRSFSVL